MALPTAGTFQQFYDALSESDQRILSAYFNDEDMVKADHKAAVKLVEQYQAKFTHLRRGDAWYKSVIDARKVAGAKNDLQPAPPAPKKTPKAENAA